MIFWTQNFNESSINKWILIVEVNNKTSKQFIDKLVIFVLKSYENAINDFIWKKL